MTAQHIDYTQIEDLQQRDTARYALANRKQFPFTIESYDKNGITIPLFGFVSMNDAKQGVEYLAKRTTNFDGWVSEDIMITQPLS